MHSTRSTSDDRQATQPSTNDTNVTCGRDQHTEAINVTPPDTPHDDKYQ